MTGEGMASVQLRPMNLYQNNNTNHVRSYNEGRTNESWAPLHTLWDDISPSSSDKHILDEDIITVEDVNAAEVKALLPLIVFYTTILTIGVIGNALVLLVYSVRYKRSPARVYILFLAGIDFAMCLFGLPYHLIDMTNPYTYTNAVACKTFTFIIVTLFHMSIFGLIVIAVDRYLKICKPLGKIQIAYFGKKRACGAAVLASLLLSWPNIVLYGRSEMESSVENVTGYACFYETHFYDTNYLFIYVMSTLCVCLGSTVFLIVAYSLICHQIYIRYKHTGNHRVSNDDTEFTDEISLKFVANENTKSTVLTNYTSSRESVNPLNKNSTHCLAGSLVCSTGHFTSQNLESHLIECNPNGSLTFIGDCYDRNAELTKEMTPESLDRTDENFELQDQYKAKLNIVGRNRDEEHFGGNKIRSCENIPSLEARKFKSELGERTKSSLAIFHTQCDDASVKLLQNQKVNASIRDDLLHQGNVLIRNNNGSSCKRLSLQVPTSYQSLKNDLALRRTSDFTDNRQRRKRWKSNGSVILSGGLNNRKSSDTDGLRIHHTSHTSLQGPIKVNKTVTRQHSKITKIMLTITMIFILSYAPTLVVNIWSIIVPEFWDELNEWQTILCEFFLRFYLINNICNPFIYGFWDKRFKREVVYIFDKLKTSVRNKLCSKCRCKSCDNV